MEYNKYIYLELVSDLRSKASIPTPYNQAKAAGLLRQLFVDSSSLYHIANKGFSIKSKVRFSISKEIKPLKGHHGIFFFELLTRECSEINYEYKEVKLDKFLTQKVLIGKTESLTVIDLIKLFSNKLGGIHSTFETIPESEIHGKIGISSVYEETILNVLFFTITSILYDFCIPLLLNIVENHRNKLKYNLDFICHYIPAKSSEPNREHHIRNSMNFKNGGIENSNLKIDLKEGLNLDIVVRAAANLDGVDWCLFNASNLERECLEIRVIQGFEGLSLIFIQGLSDYKTKPILLEQHCAIGKFLHVNVSIEILNNRIHLSLNINGIKFRDIASEITAEKLEINNVTFGSDLEHKQRGAFAIKEICLTKKLTKSGREMLNDYFYPLCLDI